MRGFNKRLKALEDRGAGVSIAAPIIFSSTDFDNSPLPDAWDDVVKFQMPTEHSAYFVSIQYELVGPNTQGVEIIAIRDEDHFNGYWGGEAPGPLDAQVDHVSLSGDDLPATANIRGFLHLIIGGGWYLIGRRASGVGGTAVFGSNITATPLV